MIFIIFHPPSVKQFGRQHGDGEVSLDEPGRLHLVHEGKRLSSFVVVVGIRLL